RVAEIVDRGTTCWDGNMQMGTGGARQMQAPAVEIGMARNH
ncbi:hypothetical protein L195_g047187, partial [Trifolium pratense]